MAIIVGTNSFVTEAEANAYFADRIGAGNYWTAGAADNEKALITAYKQLKAAYTLPVTIVDNMKEAQCEQALFLIAFADSIFRRESLQSQRVTKADIVKETYDLSKTEIAICAGARQLLSSYDEIKAGDTAAAYIVERNRVEDPYIEEDNV